MPNETAEWQKAKAHFDAARKIYQDLEGTPGVNTSMALRFVFDPLAVRYNNGERSNELREEMLAVE
jgi:hypothetical protein